MYVCKQRRQNETTHIGEQKLKTHTFLPKVGCAQNKTNLQAASAAAPAPPAAAAPARMMLDLVLLLRS
jgi:hypothetical protein